MSEKTREHVDLQYDDMNGMTIEAVLVKDECVLFLLAGDKYATVQAVSDDDEAYVQTYEQHSDRWLIYSGFDVEFLRKHRLIAEKVIQRLEAEKQEREERAIAEQRKQYEELKAKFESQK